METCLKTKKPLEEDEMDSSCEGDGRNSDVVEAHIHSQAARIEQAWKGGSLD